MRNWLIIADDLTGAADCAIAFGRHGPEATVGWGDAYPAMSDRTQIFSYNADSRELEAEESAQLQSRLMQNLWSGEAYLFRKIDSTLRGQPAADIAATIAFLKQQTGRGIGVFAPAFPATGRVTRDGKIFVNHVELEQTELWQRDHTYPTSDLKRIVEEFAGVDCFVVGLEEIRQPHDKLASYVADLESRSDAAVLVFDAQTEEDLQAIARLYTKVDPSRFFIGSAGLAHAFAANCPSKPKSDATAVKDRGGIMIVVGSLAYASRSSARELVATRDVEHFLVIPEILLAGGAELDAMAGDIVQALKNGGDVLIEVAMGKELDMSLGPKLAQNLAHALQLAAPHLAGFAATGGETASVLMDAFGINGICLRDEIEAGVSLGLTRGSVEIPVATKAGAFGDENSLVRIFDRLTAIRKEGKL